MNVGTVAVLRSEDGGQTWAPITPADTPDWAKDPDVMGAMVHGSMVQKGDTDEWYRAELLDVSRLVVPHKGIST